MSKCSKSIRSLSRAITASKGARMLVDARYIRSGNIIRNADGAVVFTGQTLIRGNKEPVPSISKAKFEMRRLIPGSKLRPGELRVAG